MIVGQQLDFSTILQHIKAGGLATRSGWNGKNMFLFLVEHWDCELSGSNSARIHFMIEHARGEFLPFIAMKNAQGDIVPWLASQGDLLATDWGVVPFEGDQA